MDDAPPALDVETRETRRAPAGDGERRKRQAGDPDRRARERLRQANQTRDALASNASTIESLARTEQEIKAQAEIDKKANENDPRKIANIELEAQGRILDARKAARAEIDAGTEAWNRQKEAREAAQGGGSFGKIQSFEEFIKENNAGSSSIEAQFKKTRAQSLGSSNLPGNLSDEALKYAAQDLDSKSQILNLNPKLAQAAKAAGQGPVDSSGQSAKISEVPISIKGEFVIRDQYGKDYTHDSTVTVGGRNGKVAERYTGLAERLTRNVPGTLNVPGT